MWPERRDTAEAGTAVENNDAAPCVKSPISCVLEPRGDMTPVFGPRAVDSDGEVSNTTAETSNRPANPFRGDLDDIYGDQEFSDDSPKKCGSKKKPKRKVPVLGDAEGQPSGTQTEAQSVHGRVSLPTTKPLAVAKVKLVKTPPWNKVTTGKRVAKRPGQYRNPPKRDKYKGVEHFLQASSSSSQPAGLERNHTQEFAERFIEEAEALILDPGEWPERCELIMSRSKKNFSELKPGFSKIVYEAIGVHTALEGAPLDNLRIRDNTDRLLGAICSSDLKEKHRMIVNGVIRRINLDREPEGHFQYARKLAASPNKRGKESSGSMKNTTQAAGSRNLKRRVTQPIRELLKQNLMKEQKEQALDELKSFEEPEADDGENDETEPQGGPLEQILELTSEGIRKAHPDWNEKAVKTAAMKKFLEHNKVDSSFLE